MNANKTARNRYMKRLGLVMVAYVLTLAIGASMKRQEMLTDTTAILAALIPGICIAAVFWVMGRYIVELKDEFMRMLMVRQALIATAFSLSVAAVHGFLSSFELIAQVDAYWWPTLWFFGLFVGAVANKIQYGTWGECA